MTISNTTQQTSNRRVETRARTLKGGKLLYGGFNKTVIDCLIVDLAEGGARVETAAMTHVPEQLKLRLANDVERDVRRCWAQGNFIGLEFMDEAA